MPRVRVYGDPKRLVEHVAGTAVEQINKKIDEAIDAATKILDAGKTRVLERLERELATILREAEEKVRAEIATREAELRIAQLRRRSEWIDKVIDEAFKRLREHVGPEAYRRFIAKLLEQAAGALKPYTSEAVVQPTASDRDVVEDLLRSISLPIRMTLAPSTVDGYGGFIASTPDGKIRLDYRLETLLADVIEQAKAVAAKELYGS